MYEVAGLQRLVCQEFRDAGQERIHERRTDFFEGHGNDVNFPGKIAKLDRAIVDPLLDVLQYSKEVGTIYSSAMLTEQREHVRVRRNEIRHRLRSLRNVVLGHLIH